MNMIPRDDYLSERNSALRDHNENLLNTVLSLRAALKDIRDCAPLDIQAMAEVALVASRHGG